VIALLVQDFHVSVSDVESMRLRRLMTYLDIFADLAKVRQNGSTK